MSVYAICHNHLKIGLPENSALKYDQFIAMGAGGTSCQGIGGITGCCGCWVCCGSWDC